jgi:hypothetical protein
MRKIRFRLWDKRSLGGLAGVQGVRDFNRFTKGNDICHRCDGNYELADIREENRNHRATFTGHLTY